MAEVVKKSETKSIMRFERFMYPINYVHKKRVLVVMCDHVKRGF